MPSTLGEPEFAPCPHCEEIHPEDVLLCPRYGEPLQLQGRLLDRKFRFMHLLGEGGMGAVWRAENVLVRKSVAIKLMHGQYARDERTMERFRNEATAAGRIGNDHICDILDLGRSQLGPYIVMELMQGRSLAELIEPGRIDPGLAVLIVRQALVGLEAAHRANIIHRDLKPENLFLHEPAPGRLMVKLMDFGISKFVEANKPRGRQESTCARTSGRWVSSSTGRSRGRRRFSARRWRRHCSVCRRRSRRRFALWQWRRRRGSRPLSSAVWPRTRRSDMRPLRSSRRHSPRSRSLARSRPL
jgi:serine/threonine protein kinase